MLKSSYTGPSLSHYQFEGLRNKGWVIERAIEVYKHHPNAVVLIELDVGIRFQKLVVKNFGWRNTISMFFSPFMRSRAQKSWDASKWLLEAGVPVPKPIAVYTARQLGFIDQNFFITEYIGKNQKSRRILRNEIIEFEKKQLIVQKMGEMVFAMHNAGMIHNDLTQGNFLVKDGDYEDIYLVDLNRLVRKSRITIAERMYDISKMNLCSCNLEHDHADCLWLYFLLAYEPEQAEYNLMYLRKAIVKNRMRRRAKKIKKGREK
ncbi:lipopolysaccharide kinase InaA family protein [bacterium]|nr:lipopolysaccharide kinase InaA family protein [bacterium]